MIRIVFLLLACILSLQLILFYAKQRVILLEKELSLCSQKILENKNNMQILKAEWSYLNEPARIEKLTQKYLGQLSKDRVIFISLKDKDVTIKNLPENKNVSSSKNNDVINVSAERNSVKNSKKYSERSSDIDEFLKNF